MANEIVKLQRGSKASIPASKVAGTILIATDTGEAYVDDSSSSRVQLKDTTKVAKTGDTMSGDLAMGDNKITRLGTPSADADAATKKYVDDAKTAAVNSGNTAAADVAVQVDSGTTSTIEVTSSTQSSGPKNKYSISHKSMLKTGTADKAVGPSDNLTPGYSGNFTVPQVTVDASGHVSAIQERTVTMPESTASLAFPLLICNSAADATSKVVDISMSDLPAGICHLLVQFTHGIDLNGQNFPDLILKDGTIPINNQRNLDPSDIVRIEIYTDHTYGLLCETWNDPSPYGDDVVVKRSKVGYKTKFEYGLAYLFYEEDLKNPYGADTSTSGTTTLSYGSSFKVPQISCDKYGRITGIKTEAFKLPDVSTVSADNTTLSISDNVMSIKPVNSKAVPIGMGNIVESFTDGQYLDTEFVPVSAQDTDRFYIWSINGNLKSTGQLVNPINVRQRLPKPQLNLAETNDTAISFRNIVVYPEDTALTALPSDIPVGSMVGIVEKTEYTQK